MPSRVFASAVSRDADAFERLRSAIIRIRNLTTVTKHLSAVPLLAPGLWPLSEVGSSLAVDDPLWPYLRQAAYRQLVVSGVALGVRAAADEFRAFLKAPGVAQVIHGDAEAEVLDTGAVRQVLRYLGRAPGVLRRTGASPDAISLFEACVRALLLRCRVNAEGAEGDEWQIPQPVWATASGAQERSRMVAADGADPDMEVLRGLATCFSCAAAVDDDELQRYARLLKLHLLRREDLRARVLSLVELDLRQRVAPWLLGEGGSTDAPPPDEVSLSQAVGLIARHYGRSVSRRSLERHGPALCRLGWARKTGAARNASMLLMWRILGEALVRHGSPSQAVGAGEGAMTLPGDGAENSLHNLHKAPGGP
ncbi:MAG: hypothetical protein EA401_02395 [Planctomycetota bacterium]|nr:MAG: hypothetical protein EA401_02395 [Planctomycetota bacterium]